MYTHFALGAAYCVLVGGVPVALQDALGPQFDTAWLWLCMGALVCLLGKVLAIRYGAHRLWLRTTGLYLQLAGDLSALGGFAGCVVSTIQESTAGKPLIAVWVFGALAEVSLFLCWRDLRRIQQAERRMRR